MGLSGQLRLRPTKDRRKEHPHSHSATFFPAALALWPLLTCLPPCPMYPLPFSMTADGSNCGCPSLQHLASTRASANCQRNERTQAFLLWKTSCPQKTPPFNDICLYHSQHLTLAFGMIWPPVTTLASLSPTILLPSLDSRHTSLLTVPQHAGPTPASP